MLERFFTSKVRVGIIHLFLKNFGSSYHIRDISRRVGSEVNAIRRELENLTKVRFLTTRPQGNRIYFRINPDFVLLEEFVGMVAKVSGLGKLVLDRKNNLGKVRFAALSSAFAQGRESGEKDVDLLVVGEVNTDVLEGILKEFEKVNNKKINCAVLSENDFALRKSRQDKFVLDILLDPRIMIIGSQLDFYKLG